MTDRYQKKKVGNIFRSLSKEDGLSLITLAQASNDLNLNIEAIGKFPETENMYFFVTSLSILRELAKVVAAIDENRFAGKMSNETIILLKEVKTCLASFETGSLVKETLKPIRDVTFHYDYMGTNGKVKNMINAALSSIESQDGLEVGFLEGSDSPNVQRYFFAEAFRSNIVKQMLSEELVSKISAVSVSMVLLVESLLVDLQKDHVSQRYSK